MKVILLNDIQKLGKKDEVKEVADGFARNFLFPKKLAVAITEGKLKELEFRLEKQRELAEKELGAVQEMVKKIEGLEVEIPVRIDTSGNLYAAVGPKQISQALKGKGFDIQKSQIGLSDDPIKEVGEREVVIEFPHGLEAKIRVNVVAEQ
ncbi:MAG: 50S ribosomal protein L9 [Candidatus Portnoybacteria bacterium]|nr:50S ribosomal protein L9 [Candidatus Portnoybacteria bacterium]